MVKVVDPKSLRVGKVALLNSAALIEVFNIDLLTSDDPEMGWSGLKAWASVGWFKRTVSR